MSKVEIQMREQIEELAHANELLRNELKEVYAQLGRDMRPACPSCGTGRLCQDRIRKDPILGGLGAVLVLNACDRCDYTVEMRQIPGLDPTPAVAVLRSSSEISQH